MSGTTILRLGDAWREVSALLAERRRAIIIYLVAAVLIPYALFFIFPQSSMRGFGAFLLNNAWYSAETPFTIVSMFLIAFWAIGAFVFAAWNAMLVETRDEVAGEVMTGLVASLLSCFVMVGMFILFTVLATVATAPLRMFAPQNSIAVLIITQLIMLLILFWMLSRFILAGPAMAALGSINPLTGLAASWRMTRPHVAKIMAVIAPLYIIAFVLVAVFIGVAIAVLRATDGTTWHDNALSAGWLALELALILIAMLLPAGLYRAIRPMVDTSIFE